MRMLMTGLVTAGLLSLSLAGQVPNLPPPFPRTGATKVLENERVIVWDVIWPTGAQTGMHRHPYDMTGVYLASGDVEARTVTRVT